MMHLGMPERLPRELDEGFDATFERLRRWFRSRGVPHEEARDLAQEAIARALIHLRRHGFDPEIGADPLLNTIGRNLLIDRARSMGPVVVPIEAAEYVDEGFDPSDEVARAAARRAVRAAIGTLSSRHRRAMLLTLDGLSPGEIADHFGIQRNAADALLHRARRRLADQLRATIGATLGWVAVIVMRARTAARRSAEIARQGDFVASGFAMNFATAVLAVGILAAPSANVPEANRSDASLGRLLDARERASVRAIPAVPDAQETVTASRPEREDFRVEQRVEDPVTDEDTYAGAYRRPGRSGNDGIIWPVFKWAMGRACDVSTNSSEACPG